MAETLTTAGEVETKSAISVKVEEISLKRLGPLLDLAERERKAFDRVWGDKNLLRVKIPLFERLFGSRGENKSLRFGSADIGKETIFLLNFDAQKIESAQVACLIREKEFVPLDIEEFFVLVALALSRKLENNVSPGVLVVTFGEVWSTSGNTCFGGADSLVPCFSRDEKRQVTVSLESLKEPWTETCFFACCRL